MLKWMRRSFVRGLGVLLPVLVTGWVAVWFVQASERLLGGAVRLLVPADWYVPGTGLALMIVIVFLVGVFAHGWLARTAGEAFTRFVHRIPMLGAIHDSMRDIADFATGERSEMGEVVLVTLPGLDVPLIGFITGAVVPLPDDDRIAVYLPMSYQIGGYMIFVERESCRRIEMSREEALRFTLTAGIARGAAPDQPEPEPD